MTNATIATTSSAPIAKLYRMCGKYNAHSACKGAFETHSVCSCPCHKAKTAKTPAAPKAPRKAKARKVAAPVAAPVAQPSWQKAVDAIKATTAQVAARKRPAAPAAVRADKAPKAVRVTFADGTSIDLTTVISLALV